MLVGIVKQLNYNREQKSFPGLRLALRRACGLTLATTFTHHHGGRAFYSINCMPYDSVIEAKTMRGRNGDNSKKIE